DCSWRRLVPYIGQYCRRCRAEGPTDRRRRSVSLLYRQNRQVGSRRNSDLVRGPPPGGEVAQFQVHFYQQETMVSPPIKLAIPLLFNLYTNPREDTDKVITDSWIFGPVLKMVGEFE